MTGKQESLYWRLWSMACVEQGWTKLTSDERNQKRHAVHINAIGKDKSHKAFTNGDCDRVFRAFKVLGDPTNIAKLIDLDKHVNGDQGERTRLYHRIRIMMPQAYLEEVMRAKFDTVNLDDLDLVQLDQLRITMIERKRARAVTKAKPAQTSIPFPTGHPVVDYELRPGKTFTPKQTVSIPF